VAYVLAQIKDATSLAFTRVTFATEDPNDNDQRWCVGDLRQMRRAREAQSNHPAYRASLDVDADGIVETSDYTLACDRWSGPHPTKDDLAAGSAPSIILRGDWEEAVPGEVFEIRLDLQTGHPVSAVEVVLDFDPSVLALEAYDVGAWFARGSDTRMLGPDVAAGRTTLGVIREAVGDPGVLGEGTVVTIQARVVGEGAMGLALPAAVAASPDGTDLPVYRLAGDHETVSLPVALRGDANGDGNRDIADAVYTLNCLFGGGQACPETDCASDANSDGAYDISDAIFMLLYLFAGDREPAPCE
jgi:hypothetical protein